TLFAQNLSHEISVEPVMTCGDRCMRSKYASASAGVHFQFGISSIRQATRLFLHQRKRRQSRMSFVHVKNTKLGIAESAQHGDAANPQNYFLTQSIALIPAIEKIRKAAICRIVFLQIRIEKIKRDRVAGDTLKKNLPGTHADLAAFHRHDNSG